MTKEKNQRLKSTKETSRINPRDIDAKNAPVIERTFPTVMEKKRGRTVSVKGFSSECEDVLHEARAKVRKFDDNNNNKFCSTKNLIKNENTNNRALLYWVSQTMG